MTVPLQRITGYLDRYLRIAEVQDDAGAVNGLQVENSGEVGWIIAAVDASQATIDGAVAAHAGRGPADRRPDAAVTGPPLILVHHGLFWDGTHPLTGRRYRRLKALLDADIALYSAHIPLDLHPEVGNNALLAAELGLDELEPFDNYKGEMLGVMGRLELPRDDLVLRLNGLLRTRARLLPGGPERTRRVGIITGGAGSRIRAAAAAGCDTFITGEGAHHTYFDAMEYGVNVIYAGHYATERVGVRALAEHVAERFGVPWVWHEHETGL